MVLSPSPLPDWTQIVVTTPILCANYQYEALVIANGTPAHFGYRFPFFVVILFQNMDLCNALGVPFRVNRWIVISMEFNSVANPQDIIFNVRHESFSV